MPKKRLTNKTAAHPRPLSHEEVVQLLSLYFDGG